MQLNLQLQIVVDFKKRAKEWHQISQIHCIPVFSILTSIHRACISIMVHDLITLKFIWPPLLVLCVSKSHSLSALNVVMWCHTDWYFPVSNSQSDDTCNITQWNQRKNVKFTDKMYFGKSCTIWHLSCIFTHFLFFVFFALFNKLWWNTISSPIFSLFFSTIILKKKVNAN